MPKLSKEQIDQIKMLLDKHNELPNEWKWTLFPPEKNEYELVYSFKKREEDILNETMAIPLQAMRSFNNDEPGWHNRLIFGDNLQTMKSLLYDPDVAGKVKLVYIDPPFATKQEFRGSKDQKAYQDKLAGAEFIEFLRKRLIFLRELLADDGSIFVHLDTKKSHYIKVIMDEVFDESNFRNEIIWKRQSAHNDSKQCGAIHDTIFFYTKSQEWTWNEVLIDPSPDYIEQFFDQVEPGTNRRYARGDLSAGGLSGGGYEYEFKGIKHVWRCPKSTIERLEAEERLHWPKKGIPRLKRYLDEFEGVPLQDIWNDIRVIHNRSKERVGYPTQKPEILLERIISAVTNTGDIVLDAFAGSGTTLAVAEKLGRRWIGIDCGKLAIYTIQKRLLNITSKIGGKGRPTRAKPFTLYNCGFYDFASLKELPWQGWRFFALQLFECKDKPYSIGGLEVDGEKKGAPVLVYNWKEKPFERISEETIDDIHRIVGNRIGKKFYIIAPMLQFDFQQDYIVRDGIKYYALRIPYSVIHELHNRDFQSVLQARDESDVNDIQEAYGFSFMVPPEVNFKTDQYKKKKNVVTITTKSFKSKAKIKGTERQGGLETFTMLLIDTDYDGTLFDLDYVFYGEQLESENWVAKIDSKLIGEKVMCIWVDHHGNEFKAVIARENFGLKPLHRKGEE